MKITIGISKETVSIIAQYIVDGTKYIAYLNDCGYYSLSGFKNGVFTFKEYKFVRNEDWDYEVDREEDEFKKVFVRECENWTREDIEKLLSSSEVVLINIK